MANVSVELPRWVSHKRVWGDKIIKVYQWKPSQSDSTATVWELACGAIIHVSKELLARVPAGIGAGGGYYVRYEDGYESWSPAKAFEEGYTRL